MVLAAKSRFTTLLKGCVITRQGRSRGQGWCSKDRVRSSLLGRCSGWSMGRTLAVTTRISSLNSLESCSRAVLGSPHDKQFAGHHVAWGQGIFSAVNLSITERIWDCCSPRVASHSIPSLWPGDGQRGSDLCSHLSHSGRYYQGLRTNFFVGCGNGQMPNSREKLRPGFMPCPICCDASRRSGSCVRARLAMQVGSLNQADRVRKPTLNQQN